jgi:hypothetical protein
MDQTGAMTHNRISHSNYMDMTFSQTNIVQPLLPLTAKTSLNNTAGSTGKEVAKMENTVSPSTNKKRQSVGSLPS